MMNDWPDRMKLYSVLATTKSLLENATPEDSFYGHDAAATIKVISQAIEYFHNPTSNAYPTYLEHEYLPMGPLQELSMTNGWNEAFLLLSEVFEQTIYSLKKE